MKWNEIVIYGMWLALGIYACIREYMIHRKKKAVKQ